MPQSRGAPQEHAAGLILFSPVWIFAPPVSQLRAHQLELQEQQM